MGIKTQFSWLFRFIDISLPSPIKDNNIINLSLLLDDTTNFGSIERDVSSQVVSLGVIFGTKVTSCGPFCGPMDSPIMGFTYFSF